MELFHEYRNKSVTAFMLLAERIANGEVFSKYEFESEYFRLSGDEKRITEVFYNNVVGNEKLQVFDFTDKNHVVLNKALQKNLNNIDEVHFSGIPLETEKSWLNTAFHDKLVKLFFSDEELSKLDFDFSEYPLYYRNIDDEWRKNENISDNAASNFRIILQAINEKKSLSYQFNGKIYESTPIKLEYDERKCKIYMIIYNGDRLIKTNISKLLNVKIIDCISDNIPAFKEEMEKNKGYKPVVFTVTDHKNRKAIERALLAFSVYDHIVEPIDEKTAKFTIQYYSMDLDLLIKDILSFGSDIIVESPKIVVNKIVEVLEKGMILLHDTN